MTKQKRYLIVGAGLTGCTLANQLSNKFDCAIDIVEKRRHIGGNCHTERDKETGIMVHEYGPHIFNTDDKVVWDFMNRFGEMMPYVHRVKAVAKGEVFSFPINLHTINQVLRKNFTPLSLQHLHIQKHGQEAKNFAEQARSMVGNHMYQLFYEGYTKKQWGCDPELLPASIAKRIPVRFDYNDNYHLTKYTGIPKDGYTALMENMIDRPGIRVFLGIEGDGWVGYDHVFYTGPIDEFFHYKHGLLSYRTVTFEKHRLDGIYQGAAQINYCDEAVRCTRIVEHKYLSPWEDHDKTIYTQEYSKETGPEDEPFYPKRLAADIEMLKKYQQEPVQNISFLGRLATYRYMDMQHVVREAIDYVKNFN